MKETCADSDSYLAAYLKALGMELEDDQREGNGTRCVIVAGRIVHGALFDRETGSTGESVRWLVPYS